MVLAGKLLQIAGFLAIVSSVIACTVVDQGGGVVGAVGSAAGFMLMMGGRAVQWFFSR